MVHTQSLRSQILAKDADAVKPRSPTVTAMVHTQNNILIHRINLTQAICLTEYHTPATICDAGEK